MVSGRPGGTQLNTWQFASNAPSTVGETRRKRLLPSMPLPDARRARTFFRGLVTSPARTAPHESNAPSREPGALLCCVVGASPLSSPGRWRRVRTCPSDPPRWRCSGRRDLRHSARLTDRGGRCCVCWSGRGCLDLVEHVSRFEQLVGRLAHDDRVAPCLLVCHLFPLEALAIERDRG